MSNILPAATISALRKQQHTALEVFGIDVTLFLANNLTSIENYDIYQTPDDVSFTEVEAKVFIEWNANQYRLRKLGLFTENELPIICHISNEIDVTLGSYLQVPVTYLPDDVSDTDEFDIINATISNLHDNEVFQIFRLVPRRKET